MAYPFEGGRTEDFVAQEIIRVGGSLLSATLENGAVKVFPLGEADRDLVEAIPPDILGAIRFPFDIQKAPPISAMIRSMEAVLKTAADFAGDGARHLAWALLASWFADRHTNPLTVVLVTSNPAAGASVLLSCSSLARRALVVTSDSAPLVASWASRLSATLFVDALAASNRSLRWAAGVNARGFYGQAQGGISEFACTRVFLATEPLPIPDAIQLPLLQGRIAPVPNAKQLDDIAREYGSCLAGYRVQHIRHHHDEELSLIADPDGLVVAERTICGCIFEDESLKATIRPLLNRQFGVRSNFETHDNLYVLTQILVSFVHDGRESVSVQELTDRMELLTTLRGDTDQGTRISVGRMLSKVGVRRDHTSKQNVVVLDPVNKNAIHQAAGARGVLTEQNRSTDCLFCDWLAGKEGLAIDQDDASGGEGNEENEETKPS